MTGQALILGATGGIGGAVAGALLNRGWRVRGLARDPTTAAKCSNGEAIEWIKGDALSRTDVLEASEGAAVIVHAVNPPGYRRWDKLVLPMIDNSVAAARASGAWIVLPGTIYNYDPRRFPVIDETTPQTSTSRKGRIRIALERRLRDASPEVRSIVLRASDFFGPGARSSWFAQAMVKPRTPVTRISHPGMGVPHSYAYLPDLAEAFARAIELREGMKPFEMLQFEGFADSTGHEMTDAISRVADRDIPVSEFPWWLMRLMSPFGGFPREVMEVQPFWRHSLRLDNRRLQILIGPEPRTPLDEAVRASLAALDAL